MKTIWTMLVCGALGAATVGCGSDDTANDAGTRTDTGGTPGDGGVTDSGGGTGDGGGSCGTPAQVNGRTPYYQCTSTPVCPAQYMNPAMTPGFRLTYLNIREPAALASAAILSVVNAAVKDGRFLWGIKFDLTANTFRTGGMNPSTFMRGTTGLGLLDGTYQFFSGNAPGGAGARYDAISGMGTLTGDRFASMQITTTVNIPIFADAAGTMLLTQLPLENASFSNVQITSDRACIGLGQSAGGRFTESTSNWLTEDNGTPYGVVEADITVTNSQSVTVELGGTPTPLCNLLSGANCMTDPQAMWPRQPTMATVNGMSVPVYHLRAEFAGVSANIQ